MNDELKAQIFTAWLVLSLIAALVAYKRGHSFFWYLILALLLSPFSSLILAFATIDREALNDREISKGIKRRCGSCAEVIRPEAKICPNCQRTQVTEPRAVRAVEDQVDAWDRKQQQEKG